MEQFTISTTLDHFVGWLNSYGLAHQYDFPRRSSTKRILNGTNLQILHHHVHTIHGQVGFVHFDILPMDAERLKVVAWTFSQMNVMGQLTPGVDNPYQAELEYYFAVLVQAIQQRWMEVKQSTRIPDTLTQREQEVASLMALGLHDKDIAERLVISSETSRKHRQNISSKWGMNTADIGTMVLEAVRRGYLG